MSSGHYLFVLMLVYINIFHTLGRVEIKLSFAYVNTYSNSGCHPARHATWNVCSGAQRPGRESGGRDTLVHTATPPLFQEQLCSRFVDPGWWRHACEEPQAMAGRTPLLLTIPHPLPSLKESNEKSPFNNSANITVMAGS